MSSSRPLLAPYRSIGLFIDENKPFLFHIGPKMYLLASTSHSFKLYKLPEMKVKLLGPNLPNKIRAIAAHTESIFLACSNKIYHFEYYHLVQVFEKVQGKITSLLNIGDLLVVGSQQGEVVTFDYKRPENVLSSFQVNFSPIAIIHPPTYLNKILVVGEKNLELRNLRTTSLIYDFMTESSDLYRYVQEKANHKASYISDNLTGYRKGPIKTSSLSLLCAEVSPALDIVAFGFSNGEVVLHNLKQNQVLQIYKIKDAKPSSISFSQTDLPLLAVGTDRGDIAVFNLNDENILSIIHQAHKSSINYVEFMKNELILLSGSYSDNSVLMWQYDELENAKFRILRKRGGLTAPIKKLRFYGDEGHHVIASSFSENAEIKDFFLWNEGFQGDFSTKRNKSLKKLNFNTENLQEVSQILDFSFASNRATDWSNLLTSHKNFDKPYLWSTEDHTLVKKNVKWEKPLPANAQITKVFVTDCGNFGIIGYADGNIMKINMQSGALQREFHQKITKNFAVTSINPTIAHKAPICGLFADPYNTVLISADTEYLLVNWDFYAGTINKMVFTYPSKITLTKASKTSSLFCVVFEDFKIEVYDQYTLNKARVFTGHKNRVMDVCFTRNNRQVVSCSLDCTIKVWDIISNQIINNLQLKTPVISLDFDPSGEFLVTAFSNSKEVFIWNNRIGKEIMGTDEEIPIKFVSEVSTKEWGRLRKRYVDKAKKAVDNDVKEYTDQDIDTLGDFFRQQNKIHEIEEKAGLVGFFEQDIGKWLPLVNFDEIREKNKPKQTVENNIVAPFFLEFDNKFSQLSAKMDGEIGEETKGEAEKPKTKVVRKENRNKFLEEVASNLERLVKKVKVEEGEGNGNTYDNMLEEMKKLTPAQVDYEIRMLTFGKIENIEILLEFFSHLFKQPSDYDLKQIYLNNFLKICSDELLTNSSLSSRVQEIKDNLDLHWKSLNDQINSNLCMVQHFAKIKS